MANYNSLVISQRFRQSHHRRIDLDPFGEQQLLLPKIRFIKA